MDSDPDPKQEMHHIKNHLKIIKKISNLIIMTLKNVNLTFSLKLCFKMPRKFLFYYWQYERKNIYSRIRNCIRNFLLVNKDPDPNPDPDPKLGRKWDPNPDPKEIVSDPQHFTYVRTHLKLMDKGQCDETIDSSKPAL
jgi:hypothetical protein